VSGVTKQAESRRSNGSVLTFNCQLRLAVTKEVLTGAVILALLILQFLVL
jgi:hypothetical protein